MCFTTTRGLKGASSVGNLTSALTSDALLPSWLPTVAALVGDPDHL